MTHFVYIVNFDITLFARSQIYALNALRMTDTFSDYSNFFINI